MLGPSKIADVGCGEPKSGRWCWLRTHRVFATFQPRRSIVTAAPQETSTCSLSALVGGHACTQVRRRTKTTSWQFLPEKYKRSACVTIALEYTDAPDGNYGGQVRYDVIQKSEWRRYFDFISRMAQGRYIEVEVAGPDIGDQITQEWSYLEGLSYEPRDDELHVHTRTIGQVILGPQIVVTSEDGIAINAITAKDRHGNIQIIHFRTPLLLPQR